VTVQQTSGVRNLAAAGSLHTTQQSGSAISYDDQSGLTAADFAAFEWRYHQYQYRNGRTTAQVGDEPARAADWELILVSSFWDSNGTWPSATLRGYRLRRRRAAPASRQRSSRWR